MHWNMVKRSKTPICVFFPPFLTNKRLLAIRKWSHRLFKGWKMRKEKAFNPTKLSRCKMSVRGTKIKVMSRLNITLLLFPPCKM